MMQVTGEEGISLEDFVRYLKARLVDRVFLQQDAFDAVDLLTTVTLAARRRPRQRPTRPQPHHQRGRRRLLSHLPRPRPHSQSPASQRRRHRCARPAPVGAHGLRLPASFTGTLPCADCEGIRHHLDLWPDQGYHMRREWLGRPAAADADTTAYRRDELGRWYADPQRNAIILFGASEMPVQWEVKNPDRLRLLDMEGAPIASPACPTHSTATAHCMKRIWTGCSWAV
jgi:hypothetical protein